MLFITHLPSSAHMFKQVEIVSFDADNDQELCHGFHIEFYHKALIQKRKNADLRERRFEKDILINCLRAIVADSNTFTSFNAIDG